MSLAKNSEKLTSVNSKEPVVVPLALNVTTQLTLSVPSLTKAAPPLIRKFLDSPPPVAVILKSVFDRISVPEPENVGGVSVASAATA